MTTITSSNLRNNLAETMEKVANDHSHLVVTRGNHKPIVMMSLEDFNSYEETAYLLQSPVNAARLHESSKQYEEGKGTKYSIDEWRKKYIK